MAQRFPRGPQRSADNSPQRARREQPARAGASVSRTGVDDRLQSYLSHHREVAADSLQRLLKTPVVSVMTWLVIAIALALPAALYVALDNIQVLGQSWDGSPRISLYLKAGSRDSDNEKVSTNLLAMTGVKEAVYISPEEGLQEFSQFSGFGEALSYLDGNPLPGVIVVTPDTSLGVAAIEQLTASLKALPAVDNVQLDMAWLKRLQQLMAFGQRMTVALALLLVLGVLLIVGNTIRLAIENRRDEILVIKLVGGTDAFVRRPFLYIGLWYGVGGGVLALLLLTLGLLWLSGPISELSASYQSQFSLQGLGFGRSLLLLLSAGAIGWLGAWIAVGRHLVAIQPR